ncbi:hypothetical protein [Riemerella anatipestifer]|uniref:hypothetical protein n=1 Tax=Riemerella anatipestifer TaxID=34085 RepID=UPI00129E1001|nr:hypothetical protein [Riemerella anatipestifer]
MKVILRSLIMTICTIFMGCSSRDDSVNLDKFYRTRVLTDQNIKDIAWYHNKYLHDAFVKFDWTKTNLKKELKVRFTALSKENEMKFGGFFNDGNLYSFEDYNEDIDSLTIDNDNRIKEFMKSDYSYIERMKSLEKNIFSMDRDSTFIIIDTVINDAKENLRDGFKLDVVLLYAEVFKNSFDFWTSNDVEFSGGKSILLKSYKTHNLKVTDYNTFANHPRWKRIVAADAGGAASALISGALFANADAVIAPPAFFARVGLSAGFSSGLAALM